jgi:hypothetical protein
MGCWGQARHRQETLTMNTHAIHQTAAAFNAQHDYDVGAALKLTELIIKHAHTVQLARKEAADPQLALPLEVAE